jgi:hypothetical protein
MLEKKRGIVPDRAFLNRGLTKKRKGMCQYFPQMPTFAAPK